MVRADGHAFYDRGKGYEKKTFKEKPTAVWTVISSEGETLVDICRGKKWSWKRDTRVHRKGRTSNKVIL